MTLPIIVNTVITRNTSVGDRATFGIPLFIYDAGSDVAPDVDFGGRARPYTSVSAMTDDGFLLTDAPVVAATAVFSQNPNVTEILIGQFYSAGTPDADYAAAASAISLENDDWYVLTAESHTEANVLALASYTEARIKMYFTSSSVAASIDTTYVPASAAAGDIAGKLADFNYTRTAHLWHDTADTTFPECAFAGRNLPFLPGKATWAFLQLAGVTASTNTAGNKLTDTQVTNVLARNSSFMSLQRGKTFTWEGKVSSGEYIDIIRGTDALKEDMDASEFDLFLNQLGGRIPMTDAGLNQIRNVMDSVLTRFVNSGFIQDNYTIFIPKAIDIPLADKTNRIVRGITFEAFLQGAIHVLNPISGNLTFETA